jgi:hypothetical protein
MKFLKQLSLIGLAWLCLVQIAEGQPCVNGISTNPNNPINDQFIPMAEAWYNLPPNDPAYAPYTDNPWLNQFNWYWPNSIKIYKHQVNWDHGWNENPAIADMMNPYDPGMPEGFEYLRPTGVATQNLDYRWEDGWELLYMNLGYYPDLNHTNDPAPGSYYANPEPPNGDPLHFDPRPSRAPYFVIYNRYRGLMRVVANVWYEAEATFNDIDVVLRFTDDSELYNKLTGLLRNASAYDKALSEPTDIREIHAPRFHAPDLTQWLVADFQVGYDPCSCMSTGELILDFNAFSTMDVEIIGRSISVDVPITELDYRTKDFLNLSAINTENYEPGTEIYKSMDALAASYQARQMQYLNDLNNYNQLAPFRMALEVVGLSAVGQFIASGLTDIELTEDLYTWINLDPIEPYSFTPILGAQPPTPLIDFGTPMEQVLDTTIVKAFSDKAKKEIGKVFGNLSTEIFKAAVPGKPKAPTVPVATMEESVYKGEIEVFAPLSTSPLILPGSLPQAWEPNTSLSPNRLPVYNEVLGQVALLKTPDLFFHFESETSPLVLDYGFDPETDDCFTTERYDANTVLNLRFDSEIEFALNPALDWDLERTQTFILIEIEIEQTLPGPDVIDDVLDREYSTNTNLVESSFQPSSTGRVYKLISAWIPLAEVNQSVFSFQSEESIVVEKDGFEINGVCVHHDDSPGYFEIEDLKFKLKSVKMKVMHDMYFDQLGYQTNEAINSMQVFTYQLYDISSGINQLGSESEWQNNEISFGEYIPGTIEISENVIGPAHPLVHEIIDNEIFINAENISIVGNGPLLPLPGHKVTLQALNRIDVAPSRWIKPGVQMRIKKDFYNTPVFDYADNAAVSAFCDENNGAYQANTASKALRERIQAQQEQAEIEEMTSEVEANNKVAIYPNPANSVIQLRSSDLGISQVDVYDIAGRLMLQRNYGADAGKQVQMDIENLQTGVYIVQIHCGAQVHKAKLVVGL